MGTIFWRLNGCWPVALWSSIDYYGKLNAASLLCAAILYTVAGIAACGGWKPGSVCGIGHGEARAGGVRVRVLRFDGTVVREIKQQVKIDPPTSLKAITIPLSGLQEYGAAIDVASVFAVAELSLDGQVVSPNLTYFVPTKQIELPPPKVASSSAKKVMAMT
jgi:beta-mannosidase